MKKNLFFKGITRILTDFFSGFLAWYLAYYLRPWTDLIPHIKFLFPIENLPDPNFFLIFTFFSSLGLLLIFSSQGLYNYPAKYLTFDIFGKIFWGILLWILCVVAVYSLVFHEHIFPRIMLAHSAFFTLLFSIFFRGILRILFEKIFRGKKSVLILGSTEETKKLQKSLQYSEYESIQKSLPDHFSSFGGEEIFFFEGEGREKILNELRNFSASSGKILHSIPAYSSEFFGHSQFEVIRGFPVLTTTPFRENIWWTVGKRLFDIFFSLCFLLFFSPLFLVLAILIKKDSKDWKAPIFYISERVGRNGKIFLMWKFRSMEINADQKKNELQEQSHRDGPFFKMKNDPRITKIGKFLRKTSLDEFPQFINVLRGEMSVIGPRPHLSNEIEKYSSVQKRVLAMKPGISGLAQVSGRSDLSFDDEIFLDSFYMENSSFFLDAKIFFKTPFILLFGKGND